MKTYTSRRSAFASWRAGGAGAVPRSYLDNYVVNVRCLDDFDLDTEKYEVVLFEGRNWEAAQEARLKGQQKS